MILLVLFRGNCSFLTWYHLMMKVETCDCDPAFHLKKYAEATGLSFFLIDPSENLEME